MSKKTDRSKRKILIGTAGVAATAVWHKPVIQSVLLPAHAQTTDDTPPPPPPQAAPTNFFVSSTQTVVKNDDAPWTPLDIFVGSANATAIIELPLEVEIISAGGDQYDVTIQTSRVNTGLAGLAIEFDKRFTGTLTLDGEAGKLVQSRFSCESSFSEPAQISNLDESARTIVLQFQMVEYVIPEGDGVLSSLFCERG